MKPLRLRSALPIAALAAAFTMGAEECQPDDYVAPWPQSNVEAPSYDESGAAGALRAKAEAYDAWHLAWHQPDHGGTITAYFADTDRTTFDHIAEFGDSTIWTGTYLASQSFRYHVTGDAQAKANAIRMVDTLDGHLHVTGATGYISRYWGTQATSTIYQGDSWCETQERCHHVESGPYVGDFWWGETSRDQYTGWILGMATAYDLVDDDATRATIAADVLEVFNMLADNNWLIIAEDGQPSSVAPNMLPSQQMVFSLVAYHVSGDARALGEVKKLVADGARAGFELAGIDIFNRYSQYYSNNLGHQLWYTILRLGKVYFGSADYQWFLSFFNSSVHDYTRLSHNAWFTGIYMSQGGWQPAPQDDPYETQLLDDLTRFRGAPNDRYFLPARDPSTYTIDPVSQQWYDLQQQIPILIELMGEIHPQALEAFPVDQQCTTDFLWQRSPFLVDACGSTDPRFVNPGVDYLAAYWLAAYHKFVTKTE